MTCADPSEVPGLAELLGRGIYTELTEHVRHAVRGQHAIVVGDVAASAAAALRLGACGCDVTLATRERAHGAGLPAALRRALRGCARISMRYGTELSWAVGVDHLEAVVLRRVSTGRIEVLNASALFVLSPVRELTCR